MPVHLMASVGIAPHSLREPSGHSAAVDRLPEEMNEMKLRDDKVSNGTTQDFSVFPACCFMIILRTRALIFFLFVRL